MQIQIWSWFFDPRGNIDGTQGENQILRHAGWRGILKMKNCT